MPLFAIVDEDRRIVVCTTNVREVLSIADRQEGWVRTIELKASDFRTALVEAAAYGLKNLDLLHEAFPVFHRL